MRPSIFLVDRRRLGAGPCGPRPDIGRYQRAVGTTSGTIDPVPGCHGHVIDLDALWLELERLEPEG